MTSPTTPAAPSAHPPGQSWTLLQRLFGLNAPVDARFYAKAGFSLMLLKYVLDAGAIFLVTGTLWSGLDYLSPLLVTRTQLQMDDRPVLMAWLVLTTLPFVWVGVSMTVRRCLDAGLKASTGLYFFLPVANYLFMLLMCVLPSRMPRKAEPPREIGNALVSALLGVAVGCALAVGMVLFSVFVLGKYGSGLFVGTPFMIGAASAWFFNRQTRQSIAATLSVTMLCLTICGGMLLLVALEGVVCLAMAFPLALVVAQAGALLGRAVALHTLARAAPLAALLLCLPLLAGAEATQQQRPLQEVASSIIIHAPPEQVWPNVIGFSELPPPPEWFFRLGIAFPMRARIQGSGVGAVRHCEFSTGPFVEPITRWEPPVRLSFDVQSQPHAMKELSPWAVVHAPHLDGFLRSKRGEFRLIPLGDGTTRLEGSTWYEVDIFPQAYWTQWSDALIHAIHLRVLNHIRTLSESHPAI